MKQLQITFGPEDCSDITSAKDDFRKCFKFSVDPFHEIRDSYVIKKWSGTNTKIHQRFLIFLEQKLQLIVDFGNVFPEASLWSASVFSRSRIFCSLLLNVLARLALLVQRSSAVFDDLL
jgi:hypothetical protein